MNANYIINQGKKAAFIQHNTALVKGYGDLKAVYAAAMETAKEYDGKVFNKRFTDAVNARAEGVGRVYVDDPYNCGRQMTFYITNRSYKNSGGSWSYFDKDMYYTVLHKFDYILKDGRIDAAKACEALGAIVERIDEKTSVIKDAIKNYDRNIKAVAKAKAEFGKAMAKVNALFVPSEVRKYDWEHVGDYSGAI